MWMKAEPTLSPQLPSGARCSSGGLCAAICSAPGKIPSLTGRGRPKGSNRDPSPSRDRAEPLSPTPKSSLQSQGNSRSRLNADMMGTAPRKKGGGLCPFTGFTFPPARGLLKAGVLKGVTSSQPYHHHHQPPKRQREPQPQANGPSSNTPSSKLSQIEEEPAQA